MGSRSVAIGQYAGVVCPIVDADGLECRLALGPWLDPAIDAPCRGPVRAAVHHSARLWAWLLLCQPAGQPLDRRLPRAAHVVSLRLLEENPRCAPWDLGEPRSPRARRYPHAHGNRVPGVLRIGPLSLSLLSQHAGPVGSRPAVPVLDQASTPDRLTVFLEKGVGQRTAQRSDACGCRRRLRGVDRLAPAAVGAIAGGAHSRRAGCLAVLRAAYLPGRLLESPGSLGLRPRCRHGQLALRSAAGAALVHRQYRLSPYCAPGAAHSQLSPACCVRIQPAAPTRAAPHDQDEPRVCSVETLGRRAWLHGWVWRAGSNAARRPMSIEQHMLRPTLVPEAPLTIAVACFAGDMAAPSELVSALPADSGAAFVFVEQPGAGRGKLLAVALAGRTTLPVVHAHDGCALEPGQIYVIPPNVVPTIARGRIHMTTAAGELEQ